MVYHRKSFWSGCFGDTPIVGTPLWISVGDVDIWGDDSYISGDAYCCCYLFVSCYESYGCSSWRAARIDLRVGKKHGKTIHVWTTRESPGTLGQRYLEIFVLRIWMIRTNWEFWASMCQSRDSSAKSPLLILNQCESFLSSIIFNNCKSYLSSIVFNVCFFHHLHF